MATTANGLPYPVGTELVRDGDNAIKALADALELRGHGLRMIAYNFGASPLNMSGDYTFTFPTAFKAGTVPVVVATPADPAATPDADIKTINVLRDYTDNTKAGLRFRRADGSNPGTGGGVWVNLVAIGYV